MSDLFSFSGRAAIKKGGETGEGQTMTELGLGIGLQKAFQADVL